MNATAILDFAAALAQNLGEFSLFLALGAVAGSAFPVALRCKRSLERTGHFLREAERARHRALHYCVLAACVAVPWVVLMLGQWIDGAHIGSAHAVALIGASVASVAYLFRRWGLTGA
jgi:hypothetical protein